MNKFFLFLLSICLTISAFGQSKIERQMGASTFEMIKKSQGLYHYDHLLEVVEEVGRKLETQLNIGYPLKYFLVDISDPNAFATAGGYVYVTRGLLAIVNSKDELAGIMGHEISHVTQRHSTKQLRASILPVVLELPANIVGLLTYKEIGNIINLPISATSKIALAAYSRSQEKEADEKGVELAIKAGFNPYGLAEALDRLTKFMELATHQHMKKNIFIDHPMTEDRIAYINQLIAKKGITKLESTPGTEILALDGLVYGQNPLEGIIYDSKFIQPQAGFYCEFPEK
jgi:predicted Zn-dependent protease